MSFICFSDRFDAFDVTPVENLFIDEYMLRAPGDFVKVYLLGLRMCYRPDPSHSMSYIAKTLQLEPETVAIAMAYWERAGIVRRVADVPPQYVFGNLKEVLLTREVATQDVYGYQDFNRRLQSVFGDRILHPQDLTSIYGWVEELGLSREAALLLVKHCLATKGAKCRVATMDKTALEWAEKGITTADAAERYVREQSQAHTEARKVLAYLGLRRSPTVAEEQLYLQWTGAWGFTLEAILAALERTTGAREPSFSYVNAILARCEREGCKTAEAIRASGDAFATKREATPGASSRAGGKPAGRPASATARPSKEVAEHRYTQRSYTNEDLLSLFDDYSDLPENSAPAAKESSS